MEQLEQLLAQTLLADQGKVQRATEELVAASCDPSYATRLLGIATAPGPPGLPMVRVMNIAGVTILHCLPVNVKERENCARVMKQQSYRM